MKPVTDPNILKQLGDMRPVEDPAILDKLNGKRKPTASQKAMVTPINRAAKGAMDPFTGLAQILYNAVPESVQNLGTQADQWLFENTGGLLGADRPFNQKVADEEKAYQEARQATGQEGLDVPRLAGNVASGTALMAMGPKVVPKTFAGNVTYGAGSGGILGMTQPVTDPDANFAEAKAEQGRLGMMTGGLGGGLIGYPLSRTIMPNAASNPEVQSLIKQGVRPTPGQIIGGAAKSTEEKLRSVPLMGDAIASSQRQGLAEFNRAAYNRALAPLGKSAKDFPVGREGIAQVKEAFNKGYTSLLSKMTFQADDQFGQEFAKVNQMIQTLPKTQQQRFSRIIQDKLIKNMTPAGRMSGESYQKARSELGKELNKIRKDASADAQDLADALQELRSSMHRVLYRSNPKQAAELSKLDKGYANFAILRRAGQMQGAEDGFTPAQLSAASKAADTSVGKGATATGNALMQDLSDAGRQVLSQSIPDSGTAGRLLLNAGALGSGAMSPAIPVGLGAGSIPYLPIVRNATALAMTQRPQWAGPLADTVGRFAPTIPYALQSSNQ